MKTFDYSPFDISYPRFATLIGRFARLVNIRCSEFMPDAPDRAYLEDSLLEWWKAQLFHGLDTEQVIADIEKGYRVGIPISELVSSTMYTIKRLHADRGGKRETSFGYTVHEPRDVFKYIVHLFSYRRVIHARSNPSRKEVRIIDTLPEIRGIMFDKYIR